MPTRARRMKAARSQSVTQQPEPASTVSAADQPEDAAGVPLPFVALVADASPAVGAALAAVAARLQQDPIYRYNLSMHRHKLFYIEGGDNGPLAQLVDAITASV